MKNYLQGMALPLTVATVIMSSACSGGEQQKENTPGPEPLYLLAGSYAPADSAGIKVFSFDPVSAETSLVCGLAGVSNPSFQTVGKDGSAIYSVSEDDGRSAATCAIAFDRDSCKLSLQGFSGTEGGAPCYISLSPDGNYVVTANYLGGNITIFPLDSLGKLGAPRNIYFDGKGPVASRQDQSHPHCISFTPDSAFMLVTDLGADRIHMFPLCGDSLVNEAAMTDVELQPGSGPRHIAWNNSGSKAYLINELSGMVTVLDYKDKALTPVQYIQADSLGAQGSADIHLSHDGRHLYASNRLKGDGIAIFSIDPSDGSLSKAGYQPTGPHPRNFIITPDDRYVLVACRDNDSIEIYTRDPETGLLAPAGKTIAMSRPVSLKWL